MSLKTGTICSKHDDIKTLADKISACCEDADVVSYAEEIADLVLKCKDDGQRMENGLDEKSKTIKDLEKELQSAHKQIDILERENSSLQDDVEQLSKAMEI